MRILAKSDGRCQICGSEFKKGTVVDFNLARGAICISCFNERLDDFPYWKMKNRKKKRNG